MVILMCTLGGLSAQNNSASDAYKLIRSNLGTGGSSKTVSTTKGTYRISQSIGQSSVIGTSFGNGYYLRQGFQQPHKKIKVVATSKNNSLKALVYPNPFEAKIIINFNENLDTDIAVQLFDVSGKLVYKKLFSPSKRIELNLTSLSAGSYMLKAISEEKLFNSKLIKL